LGKKKAEPPERFRELDESTILAEISRKGRTALLKNVGALLARVKKGDTQRGTDFLALRNRRKKETFRDNGGKRVKRETDSSPRSR